MKLLVKEEWPFGTSERKLTIAVVDTEITRHATFTPFFAFSSGPLVCRIIRCKANLGTISISCSTGI
ncbi:hypothetical protein SLEP1_g45134 [Rubroshorea leprosula]|uniref:Uncharacterized protein n=1 Tax=Rubroshorea leprosula TaxID=152421 RepID=A0AAV5LIB3_9ROSI|nr:hypothetical protein SLEP1_g45134 [Rubroshorea leprosula]